MGVKLILGWPQHSVHSYGKTIISIIELLCSVLFLHGSQERDSTTLRKGKRGCSVKPSSLAEKAVFGQILPSHLACLPWFLVLEQAAPPSAQVRQAELGPALWNLG